MWQYSHSFCAVTLYLRTETTMIHHDYSGKSSVKKMRDKLAEWLKMKLHHVRVILTFCVYGNKKQIVCEWMYQKLSQSLERGLKLSQFPWQDNSKNIVCRFIWRCTIHIPGPGITTLYKISHDPVIIFIFSSSYSLIWITKMLHYCLSFTIQWHQEL